jgi:leucyl-tRNA synthetase
MAPEGFQWSIQIFKWLDYKRNSKSIENWKINQGKGENQLPFAWCGFSPAYWGSLSSVLCEWLAANDWCATFANHFTVSLNLDPPPLGNAAVWAWDSVNNKVGFKRSTLPPSEVGEETIFPLELNTMPGWAGSSFTGCVIWMHRNRICKPRS